MSTQEEANNDFNTKDIWNELAWHLYGPNQLLNNSLEGVGGNANLLPVTNSTSLHSSATRTRKKWVKIMLTIIVQI